MSVELTTPGGVSSEVWTKSDALKMYNSTRRDDDLTVPANGTADLNLDINFKDIEPDFSVRWCGQVMVNFSGPDPLLQNCCMRTTTRHFDDPDDPNRLTSVSFTVRFTNKTNTPWKTGKYFIVTVLYT